MSGASVLRKLRATAVRFIGERKGNVAVIFALSAIPILTFVGAAIDYTRAIAARSAMQAALDSTALMLSKDLSAGTINTSQINTKASDYFNALYHNADAQGVAVVRDLHGRQAARRRQASCSAAPVTIVTDFMRVAGFNNMAFGTHLDHQLGQRPHARRAGARRHRIDGR